MIDITRQELASALIQVFEGLRLQAYKDGGGIWTIGFGHTKGVKQGDVCTKEQAQQWLMEDSAILFAMTSSLPILEAAALISFGYNCGAGTLQRVMTGFSLLTQYVHDSRGVIEPGLVARRNLESLLQAMSQQLNVQKSS